MEKKALIVIALVLALALSGCIEQAPAGPGGTGGCGNGTCDSGETVETCPEDCIEPPIPPISGEEDEQPPSLPF